MILQMKRPVSEVVLAVQEWVRQSGLDHKEIASRAEVNLTTVYRLFEDSDDRKKYGVALKRICKIANIPLEMEKKGTVPRELQAAVLDAWDGTQVHARHLARVIRGLGELTRPGVRSKAR